MKIILIFALFNSHFVQAEDQSCLITAESKNSVEVKLNNSERNSLFDQDNSLSKFKVQDQDGVGTCYANSASAVLQSIFPDQEISYQHAAISGSIKDPTNPSSSQQYVPKNEKAFTSGGDTCETINNLKKDGGACPKKYSRLENGNESDPDIQSRAMLALGKYFDTINAIKTDPEKFKQLKLEAAEMVEATKKIYEHRAEICNEKKKNGELSIAMAVSDLLAFKMDYVKFADNKSKCSQAITAEIKKLSIKSSIFSSDRVTLYPTNEVLKKFENIISQKEDPNLLEGLTKYLKGNSSSEEDSKLYKNLGNKLNKAMSELVANDKFKDVCKLKTDENGQIINPLLDDSLEISAMLFLNYINAEYQKSCNEIGLSNLNILLADEKFNCAQILPINQMLAAIKPLIELGHSLDSSMVNGITEPFSKEATQLKKLLMPECLDKKNLISLEGVKCRTTHMCDSSGKCYDLKTSVSKVRKKVLQDIQKGNALGFSTCTRYLSDPGFKSNHCQVKGSATGNHGYHSMVLTGYRCNKGKIEYEVLNSWGSSYCPEIANNKKSGIKCEVKKEGKNTGRFWVEENILVDNLLELISVSKGE